MRKLRQILLLGAGLAAVIGGSALAHDPYHEMTVRLPDGRIEHIRYSGDQRPVIRFEPAAPATPVAWADTDAVSPFAEMERISAAMDRQMDAMMRMMGAPAFDTGPQQMLNVDMQNLPKGVQGYSFTSVTANGKTCSTAIRYLGDGSSQPKVEKASSGDCYAVAKPSAPLKVRSAPAPVVKPQAPASANIIEAKADGLPALRPTASTTYHF